LYVFPVLKLFPFINYNCKKSFIINIRSLKDISRFNNCRLFLTIVFVLHKISSLFSISVNDCFYYFFFFFFFCSFSCLQFIFLLLTITALAFIINIRTLKEISRFNNCRLFLNDCKISFLFSISINNCFYLILVFPCETVSTIVICLFIGIKELLFTEHVVRLILLYFHELS